MSIFAEAAEARYLPKIEELEAENKRLRAMLERYIGAYPAFRIRPMGAPGSPVRIEQELLMALEEEAQLVLQGKSC